MWASLVAQMVKDLLAMQETWFDPWVRKIPWRREWQPTPSLEEVVVEVSSLAHLTLQRQFLPVFLAHLSCVWQCLPLRLQDTCFSFKRQISH